MDKPAGEAITVLLVDDEPLLRLGFRLVVDAQPDMRVLGEAGDGSAAVRRTVELDPDVVVMDVRMPGTDGIEATRRIVRAHPRSRVLILTTFDIDEYAFPGLKAGASGFILKNVPPHDLLAAIRTVASGEAIVAPSVTRRLLDRVAGQLPEPASDRGGQSRGPATLAGGRLDQLTPRERQVLTVLAEGLSNAEIAGTLTLAEATVKTHVSRILAKLDLRDRVQAVVLAYQEGLITPGTAHTRPASHQAP